MLMFIVEFGGRLLLNSVLISLLSYMTNGYIIWNFDLALMCSHGLRVESHIRNCTKYLTPKVRSTKNIIKISRCIEKSSTKMVVGSECKVRLCFS
jgi:hypothetical protein